MRRAAVSFALLAFLVASPASALTIVAGESVVAGERTLSLRANDLSDRFIVDFSAFDVGGRGDVALSSRVLNRVGASVDLRGRLVGGGSISITGGLVDTSARFGRRNFVWVGGTPASTAPIPEPGSALLFAVGTGLVVSWLRRLRA
jgi:hypothetical protein